MTNKYQEALDEYLKWLYAPSAHSDTTITTIKEALQAGAEGRILPKLPDGMAFAIDNTMREQCGVLCMLFDEKEKPNKIYSTEGETPAEAMQNAIDKIGGAV